MEMIDDKAFIAAMRAVVDERGRDYVYPEEWKEGDTCRYTTPDEQGCACIIGAALGHAGVPVGVLADNEATGAGLILGRLAPRVSHTVRLAADYAQMSQDDGDTWGEALDVFIRRVRRS